MILLALLRRPIRSYSLSRVKRPRRRHAPPGRMFAQPIVVAWVLLLRATTSAATADIPPTRRFPNAPAPPIRPRTPSVSTCRVPDMRWRATPRLATAIARGPGRDGSFRVAATAGLSRRAPGRFAVRTSVPMQAISLPVRRAVAADDTRRERPVQTHSAADSTGLVGSRDKHSATIGYPQAFRGAPPRPWRDLSECGERLHEPCGVEPACRFPAQACAANPG